MSVMKRLVPKTSDSVYRFLFLLMPLIYFLLYGRHGFDETDQGFIVSLSYRISLGEIPHLDFMYVRPAVTPILHTLEMILLPEQIEVIGMRFFGILYLWLSVLFAVLTFRKAFDFKQIYISPWLLGILGFVISMHNYPPMAWHTIDGVVFTALGCYLLSLGDKWYWIISGLMAMVLAALSKQPFGVVPIVGGLAVLWMYPLRRSLSGLAAFTGIIGILTLILVFIAPGKEFFQEMLRQSFGATDPEEIVWPGIKIYVWPALFTFVPLCLVWAGSKMVKNQKLFGLFVLGFVFAGLLIFYGVHIYFVYSLERFVQPRFGTYHAMVFCGAGLGGLLLLTGEKKMALILVMSAGAWAAGISWGYPTPVHFMVPALFMLAYFISMEIGVRPPKWYFPSITALALVCYFLMYQYPFREPHRSEIVHHLGDHFPKLNFVYTNSTLYEKYGEVKTLHEVYGDNFTVLPALPLANYLTNTKPPISIDWAHDAEIAYEYGLERNLNELESRRPTVFVDKVNGPKEAYDEIKQYRSLLTKHVLDNWIKVDETEHYYVYQAS